MWFHPLIEILPQKEFVHFPSKYLHVSPKYVLLHTIFQILLDARRFHLKFDEQHD